jgi:D-serine deaminase-like pyridoxal phosphate-dependent protein
MDVERILAATEGIITPVAVVDEEVVERNLARMAKLAADHKVKLRPHAKTHKSAYMAQRQMAHGAVGLTCATFTEAEVFADAGVDDLLIAHPPVGRPKLERLAGLAKRVKRIAVSLDDVCIAKLLPESVVVLWEVDPGQHRIGTAPGEPTVKAVQELVRAIGAERFRGLITHGGHVYAATNQNQRQLAADQETDGISTTADMLRMAGIEVRELSVGSTPTAGLALRGEITEMRPGTYIYGDANQVSLGSQRLEDCALAVVATVVSTPAPDRAVVDAGSKALSADLRVAGLSGYGMVLGRNDLTVARLSEEHAVLTTAERTGLAVGIRLIIMPAHACTTVYLHPTLLLLSGGSQVQWFPVDARGWQQQVTSGREQTARPVDLGSSR